MSTHHEVAVAAETQNTIDKKTEVINQLLGDYYGSIYKQLCSDFYCDELRDVSLVVQPDSTFFSGGEGEDADGKKIPAIVIGTKNEVQTKTIQERVISRFGIPRELVESEAGPMVCRLVAFAHELGHVIQLNPGIKTLFGGLNEEAVELPDTYDEDDYRSYVESEREQNADYIACVALAGSDLGKLIGLESPSVEHSQWRMWAQQNPVEIKRSFAISDEVD